ncbi:MAG: bifunctional glutamate N-acetyltransferase/amino-acid acetyltransferase ArgJ [Lachnospiraceae bacterium]|nr:bifunctional glutamate N-acetyltransferase/amino-acid acetyltransferase ArgJ [Lachnospiraceae bacterium]
MQEIQGGITAAKGFKAASAAAGIKYQGRNDMAMILSDVPCTAAGTFTSNIVKAAPVLWDRKLVQDGGTVRAVVVNTGIANAGCGPEGMAVCEDTAAYAAEVLGITKEEVLIGSTGVIGPVIDMNKLKNGIRLLVPALSDSREAAFEASKAIMTTDTVNKECAVSIELPSSDGTGTVTVTLGGMSKGSGMIHPNMCTMLGYIATDAAVEKGLLQKALSAVVPDTFNMITVDGDTSTNDTLLVLSNGLAENAPITEEDESFELFKKALTYVCKTLAIKMAADGEGASKLIEVCVKNADTKENARTLARSVAGSSLVKAMIFGKDANCGRILCALGYAGPGFDPAVIEIDIVGESGKVNFYTDGKIQPFDEELALAILSEKKIHIDCDMAEGTFEATAWGCDLTYDYVSINADYRS